MLAKGKELEGRGIQIGGGSAVAAKPEGEGGNHAGEEEDEGCRPEAHRPLLPFFRRR